MKIILAGAGAFGAKHLDAIRAIGDVEVVSLVGRTLEPTRAMAEKYRIEHVTTERLPVGAILFSPSGWSIGVATAYVRQRGLFSVDVGLPEFPKRDRAWLTDLFLSYRLPGRAGILSIGARNVFDKSIDVFNTDPANPRIPTRRFLFAKASLGF